MGKEYYLFERYIQKKRPFFTYIPIHYHRIPFKTLISRLFYKFKKKGKEKFPNWPIEKSIDLKRKEVKWPNNKKYVICLTHDVDTKKGIKKIKLFYDLERKYNIKSTYYIVSKNLKFINFLKKIEKQGYEIACHGYNHDNKLAYLNEKKIKNRLKKSKELMKEFNVKGFRAPSLLTSEKLYSIIPEYFSYDSSVPDTDIFLLDAPRRGCCTVFPFMRNKLVVIPITVPMDASLILGDYKDKIYKIWLKKNEYIKKIGGVAVIVTHTEDCYSANKEMLEIYEKLLKKIKKDKKAWITTMNELAEFWKKKKKE